MSYSHFLLKVYYWRNGKLHNDGKHFSIILLHYVVVCGCMLRDGAVRVFQVIITMTRIKPKPLPSLEPLKLNLWILTHWHSRWLEYTLIFIKKIHKSSIAKSYKWYVCLTLDGVVGEGQEQGWEVGAEAGVDEPVPPPLIRHPPVSARAVVGAWSRIISTI